MLGAYSDAMPAMSAHTARCLFAALLVARANLSKDADPQVKRDIDDAISAYRVATDRTWPEAAPSGDVVLDALRLARDDLQLISDQGEGSHGRTVDALIDAMFVQDQRINAGTPATPDLRIVLVRPEQAPDDTRIVVWDNLGDLPAGEHFLYASRRRAEAAGRPLTTAANAAHVTALRGVRSSVDGQSRDGRQQVAAIDAAITLMATAKTRAA